MVKSTKYPNLLKMIRDEEKEQFPNVALIIELEEEISRIECFGEDE